MTEIMHGSCHCGAVEFAVTLRDGLKDVRRCNCSLCRRKGTVMASVPLADLTICRGVDNLTLYQWNTNTARHYFCRTCGIYTHHQKRSDPTQFGFNVACIDSIDPFSLDDVPVMDGINHPSDR